MIGSEKQVKWAIEIKESLICSLNKLAEDKMNKELIHEINDCVEFVKKCNEAARFIEHGRDIDHAIKSFNLAKAMNRSIHLSGVNEKNAFSALYEKEKEL